MGHRWLQGSHYPLSVSWRFSMSGIKCHAAANGKILRNIADSTPFFQQRRVNRHTRPLICDEVCILKNIDNAGFFPSIRGSKISDDPEKRTTEEGIHQKTINDGLLLLLWFIQRGSNLDGELVQFLPIMQLFFNNLRLGIFQPAVQMRCIVEPNC